MRKRSEERGVGHHRGAALIAGTVPVGSYQIVVLDSDGDRLGVAESVGRRMAPGAGFVVMQGMNLVEEQ